MSFTFTRHSDGSISAFTEYGHVTVTAEDVRLAKSFGHDLAADGEALRKFASLAAFEQSAQGAERSPETRRAALKTIFDPTVGR